MWKAANRYISFSHVIHYRLYPVAPVVSRVLQEDMVLKGYRILAQACIIIIIIITLQTYQ